ncbi:MAG: N-acetyltransferase [Nitratireductor sp.]|nr:N-acetyltransferase [Nitratireductor sp.]
MLCNKLTVRRAVESDHAEVLRVEREAFGREDEATLVDRLVPAPEFTLSLIAECDGRAVGHVLLTEIAAPLRALALAPLAVIPAYREMQIGTQLVHQAISDARNAGYEAMFVLGDTLYYERFGFSSTLADPFEIAWQGPHFMALELAGGALAGKSGRLDYPVAFFG